MRSIGFVLVVMLLTIIVSSQTIPHHFSAHSVASADSVNANFAFLLNEIKKLQHQNDSIANVKMTMPMGTIIASVLDSMEFSRIAGEGWVLADGRLSPTSYYTATSKTNVPDLRGRFLRGCDAGSGNDPDVGLRASIAGGSDVVVGSYQNDSFRAHSHYLNKDAGQADFGANLAAGDGAPGSERMGTYTGSAGGTETRPKNVAVYYYVKVK